MDDSGSTTLRFENLGADDYDRGKRILNRARHPGFIGRDLFYRCATKGRIAIAVENGADIAIAMVDHKGVLGTLSVVQQAQGRRVGQALMAHVRPQWVKAIEDRVSFFERIGYERVGSPSVGQKGKHATQLMKLSGDVDEVEVRSESSEIDADSESVTSVDVVSMIEMNGRRRLRHQIEMLHKLAQKAELAGDYKTAAKLLDDGRILANEYDISGDIAADALEALGALEAALGAPEEGT